MSCYCDVSLTNGPEYSSYPMYDYELCLLYFTKIMLLKMMSRPQSNIFVYLGTSLTPSAPRSQTTCYTPGYLFRRQFTFSVTESWKYVWLCAIKGTSPGNTTVAFDFSPIFHSISDIAASNASFCWFSFGFNILRKAITKTQFSQREMESKRNKRFKSHKSLTYTSSGTDFRSRGRISKMKCFMMNACSTDCSPLVAFRGDRNPYGSS